jgi:hypothetical protein
MLSIERGSVRCTCVVGRTYLALVVAAPTVEDAIFGEGKSEGEATGNVHYIFAANELDGFEKELVDCFQISQTAIATGSRGQDFSLGGQYRHVSITDRHFLCRTTILHQTVHQPKVQLIIPRQDTMSQTSQPRHHTPIVPRRIQITLRINQGRKLAAQTNMRHTLFQLELRRLQHRLLMPLPVQYQSNIYI